MLVRNSMNYVKIPQHKIVGLSKTVPDKAMSITEIMVRFARGQPLGGRSDVYYDEDSEFDTEKDYDLTELQELKRQHSENFQRLKESHEKFKSNLDKSNADKQYFERLKKEGYAKNELKESSEDV